MSGDPCKHCGGAREWFTSIRNKTQVVDGRLKTSDVECLFVCGCTDCGETLEVHTADDVVGEMNKVVCGPKGEVVLTLQQISDYLAGLDAVQREVSIRDARSQSAPAGVPDGWEIEDAGGGYVRIKSPRATDLCIGFLPPASTEATVMLRDLACALLAAAPAPGKGGEA